MYLNASDFEKIILNDGTEITDLIDIDHVGSDIQHGALFFIEHLYDDGKLETRIIYQDEARFIRKKE